MFNLCTVRMSTRPAYFNDRLDTVFNHDMLLIAVVNSKPRSNCNYEICRGFPYLISLLSFYINMVIRSQKYKFCDLHHNLIFYTSNYIFLFSSLPWKTYINFDRNNTCSQRFNVFLHSLHQNIFSFQFYYKNFYDKLLICELLPSLFVH